jgi:hypothetical protein
MNLGGWPTCCQPERPFSSVQNEVEQDRCANVEKLAQPLPNSCGLSKKADSKDKNSATTER